MNQDPGFLLDLPLDDLSLDVRAVLAAPKILLRHPRDDGAILSLPNGPGEYLCVTQSSTEAWFSVAWEDLQCDFYYHPSGDDLVLKNRGSVDVSVVPLSSNGKTDQDGRQVLWPRAACLLSPGPWRISLSQEQVTKVWADILLFRRRYVIEKSAPSAGETGLKSESSLLLSGASKRVSGEAGQSNRSVVSANPSGEESFIFAVDQPLGDFQPGETVTIRSLVEDDSTTESRDETLDAVRHSSENYSLTHLQDIAVEKGLSSSVFCARHSVFGHTAVKVIHSLKNSPAASIPHVGQMWLNEVELMRTLDHPCIIKMFGSDARLYSIYMEHLPYSDLAEWRDRSVNHFFTGTPEDAERVLSDMASALVYLEKQGIIHNDIKPSNILYHRKKGATLIDFGLASTTADDFCPGGSALYKAPEFLSQTKGGVESDVFALGVTLLYLLKKTQLPEVAGCDWFIANPTADNSQGQLTMGWSAKVDEMAHQLAVTGIESVVRGMLDSNPLARTSPRGVAQGLVR